MKLSYTSVLLFSLSLTACSYQVVVPGPALVGAPVVGVPVSTTAVVHPVRIPTVAYIQVLPTPALQPTYFPVYVEGQVVPSIRTPSAMDSRDFTIYFRHDSSTLDGSASQTLREAMALLKEGHGVRVQIYGHTDRSGSASYNQELSERRAMAVRDAMVRLGAPAGAVTFHALGEAAPVVPTRDGVRHRANRRVDMHIE